MNSPNPATKETPPAARRNNNTDVCVLATLDENAFAHMEHHGVAKVESASPGGTTIKTHQEGLPIVSLEGILARLEALEGERITDAERTTKLIEGLTGRVTQLEDENKALEERVAQLEAENKVLKESNTKLGKKAVKDAAKIRNLEKNSNFFTAP